MLVKEIINPGGISHHQYPRISADAACASCSICPQVGKVGSPNPRKLNEDSYNIAAGTANAKLARVKGNNWGTIWRKIIFKYSHFRQDVSFYIRIRHEAFYFLDK